MDILFAVREHLSTNSIYKIDPLMEFVRKVNKYVVVKQA